MSSPVIIWRVIFVSLLFILGAFGLFYWAVARGLPVEEARTIVVNAIVVFEIFYLFSVRYTSTWSIIFRSVLGTPAVLLGAILFTAAQFAFTYLPMMQLLFDSRAVSLSDSIAVLALALLYCLSLRLRKESGGSQ